MSLKNNLINWWKGDVSKLDIYYYLQGTIRCKIYYSKFPWLIRKFIREQIAFRILVMKKECLANGECIVCGCATPALQMCNKSCDSSCYPPMMTWDDWNTFQRESK